jgi:hypothetical protein
MQGTSRFKVSVMTFAVMLAFAGVAQAQSQSVKSAPTDAVVGHAPEIVAITITGTPNGPGGTFTTNDVLTMEYEFTDPDQDPIAVAATEATIQWYSGTTAVGTLGSKTYTILASDAGKVITVKMTPYTDSATTNPYTGALTDSSVVSAGADGSVVVPDGRYVLALSITGDAEVGETLTAVPSCGATCVAGITYQWQIETAPASGTYQNISGATGTTYTPVRTDQKKKIQVIATNPLTP